MRNISRSRFRPELLPPAQTFYERELGRLGRPRRGWASCSCPFHEGKSRAAFGVNFDTGAFNCFSCGAKGDIIKFVMLRDHLNFKAAAQALGCWDESPSPESVRKIAARSRERERRRQAEELRKAEERQRRLELRDHLLTALDLQREISKQLVELHREGSDEDSCWRLLSSLADYVRECDREYCDAAELRECE